MAFSAIIRNFRLPFKPSLIQKTFSGDLKKCVKTPLFQNEPIVPQPPTILSRLYSSRSKVPDENPLNQIRSVHLQKDKGKIYDKKPIKLKVEKGKTYTWCCCGHSKNQPFCDKSHEIPQLKIKLRPVEYLATETKEIWFCNCKQTDKRPFCDGTHKKAHIQEAIKS